MTEQDEITGLAVTTTVMPVIFLAVAFLILHVLMTRVVRVRALTIPPLVRAHVPLLSM